MNKYIYNKTGDKISTKLAGTDEEFKREFGNDIFISDVDLGEKAIIEDRKIRVKTEAEKVLDGERVLQEGEYIEGKEIKHKEKPDNFYLWDSKTNEWIYDKELEISSLEEELGTLEMEIYELEHEIKNLKEVGKTFSLKKAVKLEEEVEELDKVYQEKMTRYEELEG